MFATPRHRSPLQRAVIDLFLVLSVFSLMVSEARAQAPEDEPEDARDEPVAAVPLMAEEGPIEGPSTLPTDGPPRPLAIVVSGGASLGAWEAGYLYYLLETLRAAEHPAFHLRAVAGTSAGAINAFLAVLEHCSESQPDPEQSLFYQSWIPVGIGSLYREDSVTPTSVFDRAAFDDTIAMMRARFDEGGREGCELVLGMTATRMHPTVEASAEGRLGLARMAERFLVRLRGRGPGHPLEVTSLTSESLAPYGLSRLPLTGANSSPFDSLRDVALASSAFPVAFAPQSIATCPRALEGECTPEQATRALYVDGGLFDNEPLDVGYRAMSWDGRLPDRASLLLVDPLPRRYPVVDSLASDEVPEDLTALSMGLTGSFISSMRSGALDSIITEHPEIATRLWVTSSAHPPMGDLLQSFLALFEQDFRRFDFALGMLAAERTIDDARGRDGLRAALGDVRRDGDVHRDSEARGWRVFRCVRSILTDGAAEDCDGSEPSIVALARVSRERVFDACASERLPIDPAVLAIADRHPDCHRARAGESPSTPDDQDWARAEDEGEIAWVFRRLGHHGFVFRDLGTASDGAAAYRQLRSVLQTMAHSIASQQGALGPAMSAAVDVMLDDIGYVPESHLGYLDLGPSVEVGWSGTTGAPAEWLRFTVGLDFRGIDALISSQPSYFGLLPLAGVELEALPLSSTILSVRLSLRAGFLFSSGDSFLSSSCDHDLEPSMPCSRMVTQLGVRATILRLVRVGLVGEWMPALNGELHLWSIRPMIGVQLSFD
jgi:hypothetical protein